MRRAIPGVVFAAFFSCVLFAQSDTKAPEFEVASIRKVERLTAGQLIARIPSLNVEPGRTLTFENVQLRNLIMLAYGVGVRQISGPDWLTTPPISSHGFDIAAKIPADAAKGQVPLMLQALLSERFKLVLHRDQKLMEVYALEVGKGGPKLREAAGENGQSGCQRSLSDHPGASLIAVCQGMTAAAVAQQLPTLDGGYFKEPVIDKTGLKGVYNFELDWIMKPQAEAGMDGQTMFEAVQNQLGLKLERQKQMVEVLVVDHCEKEPTEN